MGVYLGSNPVGFTSYIVRGNEQENALVERTLTTYENSMVSKVGNYAFTDCSTLTSVNLSLATTIGDYAFQNCSTLTSVNLSSATTIGDYAFRLCSALPSIDLPLVTTIGSNAFKSCYSLTSVNLPLATTMESWTFAYCYNLLSLYLTNSVICTLLSTNAFNSTPISNYTTSTSGVYGSIYVPASLYSDYIAATNWAVYSSRFVSIQ